MDDSDPWLWSVSQVTRFFRHRAFYRGKDKHIFILPDLDAFEAILVENNITGEEFLTFFDRSVLEKYCGVTSLRVAISILHCINELRQGSAIYREHHGLVPTVHPVGGKARAGEGQIVDEDGRKRRRLNLSTAYTVQTTSQDVLQQQAAAYLQPTPMPIDELIYGTTKLGQEVQESRVDGNVLCLVDESPSNFTFIAGSLSDGVVDYVHSQVRHLLHHTSSLELKRHGHLAVALYPYRQALVSTDGARSATVFQTKDNREVVAVREKATYLQSAAFREDEIDYNELSHNGSSDNTWDWLIEKYGGRHASPSIELDQLTNEELHSSDSDAETAMRDSEAEEEDEDRLVVDRVKAFVENAISRFIDDWRAKLPHLEENKAWATWRKTKQSRSIRSALIENATRLIENFDARLEKLKRGIRDDQWHSQESLANICEILRPTIEDRELQKWKIDVWQRKSEPEHIARHVQAQSKNHRRPRVPSQATFMPSDDRFSVSPRPVCTLATERDDRNDGHTSNASPMHASEHADSLSDFVMIREPEIDSEQTIRGTDMNWPELTARPLASTSDQHYANAGYEEDTEDSHSLPSIKKLFSQRAEKESQLKIKTEQAAIPNTPNVVTILSSDDDNRLAQPNGQHSRTDFDTRPRSESPPLSRSGRKRSRKHKTGRDTPSSSIKRRSSNTKGSGFYGSSEPLTATSSEVDSWNLEELKDRFDRTRIMIKMLSEVDQEQREVIHTICRTYSDPIEFREHMSQMLEELSMKPHETSLEGRAMQTCAKILHLWPDPAASLDQTLFQSGHGNRLWEGLADGTFLPRLKATLQRYTLFKTSTKPATSASSLLEDVIVLSSETSHTPRKKRKQVKQSKATEIAQERALDRHSEWIAVRQNLSSPNSSQQRIGAESTEITDSSEIVVNPVKAEKDMSIYIPQRIAKHMKSHQIDGVQFMWRELTAGTQNEEDSQGCILAHTMGLGKTMQSIALLCTLEKASKSNNPSIYNQLPFHLRLHGERSLRILVLCPPALVQNWEQEIALWAGQQFRQIYMLESTKGEDSQVDSLKSWFRLGGVLLAGYQMFRSRLGRTSARCKSKDLNPVFEEILLEGPDVVIADEAHNLKNREASVSVAASRIRTPSRIGLTGTPMSNDVPEIYALVSWVAPGYLGDPGAFSGFFTNPIKDGTYEDSDPAEVRRSLVKLAVLRRKIEPKVHRADITVLRGSLKPKVEFVITLPLLEVQTMAYTKYVSAHMARAGDKLSQVKIFSWLFALTLLTNHPLIFKRKLSDLLDAPEYLQGRSDQEPRQDIAGTVQARDAQQAQDNGYATPISEVDKLDLDASVDGAIRDLPQDVIRDITLQISDEIDSHLSAKMVLLLKIIELSRQHHDRVLVFSSSVPTLDYVETLLMKCQVGCARIGGNVAIPKRRPIIEDFRGGKFEVMLISTRAGGVGLNIQNANRVVLLDFGFNPAHEEQAIGRAYRLGQVKPVFVYRFVAGGTFETNIYNQQLFKTSLTSRVVDKKNPRRIAERNTKDWLYEPRYVPQEDLSRELGKDPHVLDSIIAEQGPAGSLIRALQTMETLQEESTDAPLSAEEHKMVAEEIKLDLHKPKLSRPFRSLPNPSRARTAATAPQWSEDIGRPGTQLPRAQAGHAHPTISPSHHSQTPQSFTSLMVTIPTNGVPQRSSSSQRVSHGLPLPSNGHHL